MPPPAPHYDLSTVDLTKTIDNIEGIRRYLPHRHPMEMLTAIVMMDTTEKIIIGYKDVGADEFWVPGHMPGFPIFPGVLMLEAAAQLSAYYTIANKISQGVMMGLGGIENSRFRRGVHPGERLVMVGKGYRVKPRMTLFNIQGFVDNELAFHTDVIGVGLGKFEDL